MACKDEPNVLKKHLMTQVGIQDQDLDRLAGNLRPRLPELLTRLVLDNNHFRGEYYTQSRRLDFLASINSIVLFQAKLDDTSRDGLWHRTQSSDPTDRYFYRPVGMRECM